MNSEEIIICQPCTGIWYKCDVDNCEHKSKRNSDLKKHKANVHDIGVNWFKCGVENCEYKSKQNSDLTQHKAHVHDIGVNWYKCDFENCEYKSKQNSHLTQHKADVHDIGVNWSKCDVENCEYKSKQNSTLKRHKAGVHDIGVNWFKCGVENCEYKSKENGTLKQHKANVHDIDVNWFKCEVENCEYKSKQNSNLTQHKADVHDIGDYECEFCARNVGCVSDYEDKQIIHSICRKCFHKCTGCSTRIEKVMLDFLKDHIDFPIIRADSRVMGEVCYNYRPDVMIADNNLVIHIECDEHQHGGVSYSCDEKRMSDLYDEYPGKHVVWIRWNPNGYKPPVGVIKKSLEERKVMLVDEVNKSMVIRKDQSIMTVIYMFFSEDNSNVTRNISKKMIY
jgi:hypothetical protein